MNSYLAAEHTLSNIIPDRDNNLDALLIAVISRAVRDLNGNDFLKSIDAYLWLQSLDCALFIDVLGVDNLDITKFLISGHAKKIRFKSTVKKGKR